MKTDKIYKLNKSGVCLIETDARCVESAMDYFMEFYPDYYYNNEYNVEVSLKEKTETFFEKNYSSFLMNHQLK
jgi:hypothetical protein